MRESLLTPSLSAERTAAPALYSVQSGFLVAFFGGGFAIILYAALNSWKLRRPLDALAYVAATILMLASLAAMVRGWEPLLRLLEPLGNSAPRYFLRALSLLLFGAFYLLHRKQHRSASLFGIAPSSPWIAAIACGLIGYGINYGVVRLLSGAGTV